MVMTEMIWKRPNGDLVGCWWSNDEDNFIIEFMEQKRKLLFSFLLKSHVMRACYEELCHGELVYETFEHWVGGIKR